MWTPPERIKHALPAPGWPTAAEAEAARLFAPVAIGPLVARQRTWVPAMVPWRATDDGFVTDDVVDWYARFAAGRPGVIVVEATGIRDIPSGPLLRIGHDRFVPGLERLVAAVRDASAGETLLFVQLIDFLNIRRRPERRKYFDRFLVVRPEHRAALGLEDAPEPEVRGTLHDLDDARLAEILSGRELESLHMGHRERVTDTWLPHIRDLPEVLPGLFADAAVRAAAAGFDGVELHYAHAYTMASFLSRANDRGDGYGGSPAGRLRLPLEVAAAVRRRLPDRRVLGVRFLGDEVFPGGSDLADAEGYAVALAGAGLDYLSLSKGGKFEDAKQPKVGWAAYPYTGPSGYECMPTIYSDARGPFSRNVPWFAAVKRVVAAAGFATPVVGAGGIGTFAEAEAILARGEADIVGTARAALADPDLWRKVKLGRGGEVRRCEYTNYCEGLDQVHKQVTCKLWDRKELSAPDVKLDVTGHRRLTRADLEAGMTLVLRDAAWVDVRELLLRHPDAVALLPVGALEAHGPHLPLATDVVIAEGLCRRAAAALGPATAIAPAIVYSVTDYAGGFAGTTGIAAEVATAHVRGVVAGLRAAGFRRVVLANAHLEPAHVASLRAAVAGRDAILADCTERRFARTLTEEYKRGACHAGSYETSLLLAERPELVRDERRAGLVPLPIDLAKAMRAGVRTFAEAGAPDAYFGDPAAATREEGEWIFARLVEMVVTVVHERWPDFPGD